MYRFRYTNIGFISSSPSTSIDFGSLVNFQLLSSALIVVDLTDGTQVTTSVTSANFSLSPQAVPEPTSILSLLALGTLGAASTLKRQIKSSKPSEKETTKVG
ncbi:MAG: PEP-CTERM sorting domain-containing protein [Microcystis aeruginosa K13-07]|nr:PEP-CTERM sorting domain-containing protein [Microcystis aeruginosa K13-07]